MTGSGFQNQSTDANLLAGMANLKLIYESTDANYDPFEVAGKDFGATPAGFNNNFGVGTLQLGGELGDARLILVDLFDNQPDFDQAEALYLQSLVVNPGSELCLNGLHLYVDGVLVNDGDGGLYGGGKIYTDIPEPEVLPFLLAFAAFLLHRPRPRFLRKPSTSPGRAVPPADATGRTTPQEANPRTTLLAVQNVDLAAETWMGYRLPRRVGPSTGGQPGSASG